MKNTKILLGKRIRYLRRSKDFSQEQLAEKANISSKYLGEIERGKANLTIDVAEQLSKALNIEISSLVDYQHEMDTKSLKNNINMLIRNASDDDLKTVYRVLKSILI